MNTLTHHFKKDCRRFGAVAAIWALSLALVNLSHFFPATDFGPEFRGLAAAVMASILVIYAIFTAVLAAGVILEDPPMGTTAFWLTRPLRRSSIIGEKLLFLAAIIAVPIIVDLAIMAFAGAGPQIVAVAALDKLLFHVPFILALAVFAVTAETYGRWVINAALILIGTAIGVIIWVGLVSHKSKFMPPNSGPTLPGSKELVLKIVVSLLAGGVLIWRYSRRHARFAIAVLALAAAASMLIPWYWRWDFLSPTASEVPTVEMGPVHFTFKDFLRSNGRSVFGLIPVVSDGHGNIVVPRSASEIRLTWADGRESPAQGMCIITSAHNAQLDPAALARAVAPLKVLNPPAKRPTEFMLPFQPSDAPARLDATVTADLCRFKIMGELPLKAGARISYGLRRLGVLSVDGSEGEAQVVLRVGTYPSALANAIDSGVSRNRFFPSFVTATAPTDFSNLIYLLVNRSRNEAVAMETGVRHSRPVSAFYGASGATRSVNFTQDSVTIGQNRSRGGYLISDQQLDFSDEQLDGAWMKDATLVLVQTIEVGRTTVALSADDLDGEP